MCEDHASGEEHESMEETAAKVKGDVGETEVEKVKIVVLVVHVDMIVYMCAKKNGEHMVDD